MSEKKGERIFGLLILLFVLAFLAMALQMNSVAGRMPTIVGTFTLILVVAYFIDEFRPRKATPAKKFVADLDEDDEHLAPEKDELDWWDIRVWGWLIVLFVFVYLGGIILGIGLLTAVFYRYAAKQTWRGGIIFGVLQCGFLYVVFEIGFKSQLYPGLIIEKLLGG